MLFSFHCWRKLGSQMLFGSFVAHGLMIDSSVL